MDSIASAHPVTGVSTGRHRPVTPSWTTVVRPPVAETIEGRPTAALSIGAIPYISPIEGRIER